MNKYNKLENKVFKHVVLNNADVNNHKAEKLFNDLFSERNRDNPKANAAIQKGVQKALVYGIYTLAIEQSY